MQKLGTMNDFAPVQLPVPMPFSTDAYEPLHNPAVAGAPRFLVFVVEDEEDIARLISHNLHDVFAVGQKIWVLRLGRNAGIFDRKTTTQDEVVHAITAGIAAWKSTGATVWLPVYLSYLARAHAALGHDRANASVVRRRPDAELEPEVARAADQPASQKTTKMSGWRMQKAPRGGLILYHADGEIVTQVTPMRQARAFKHAFVPASMKPMRVALPALPLAGRLPASRD